MRPCAARSSSRSPALGPCGHKISRDWRRFLQLGRSLLAAREQPTAAREHELWVSSFPQVHALRLEVSAEFGAIVEPSIPDEPTTAHLVRDRLMVGPCRSSAPGDHPPSCRRSRCATGRSCSAPRCVRSIATHTSKHRRICHTSRSCAFRR